MPRVEFVWHARTSGSQVPIPGLTTGIWHGDNQPLIQAVLVSATRLPGNRYRLVLSTSDLRMQKLNQQCQHKLMPNGQHGPDVYVRCNIVIGECLESPQ